ncbi:chitin synthase chs-2 isoform X2 [Magallana gigas]|uniref:chitin synthase chs-2 isoform X2 n=1 Tax=Magallana gigas TaxID=29159 RepID=UPI00333F0D49
MEDPGSDLSQLDKLTEESILEAVKNRYQEDKIYTNVGDILIAVNPFKELQIYDKKNHEKYGWKDFRTDLPPHVFHVAARAYGRMRQKQSNQIILVCGESGAGKTESAKYMVQHFMQMCPEDSGDLHDRIIRVNPLLESFGNAKTVMNDNSSRFAKFLELSFRNDGQVTGASIRDYMLEKCRVVGRNEDCGEGNFHIFYGMFAGLSQQEKQDLFLLKPESYGILKGSIERLKMTKHYENQYKENMETLKKIGMTEADKKVMHCMLAAILHLSQIEFRETEYTSGQLDIADTELVDQAATLLEVSSEALGVALISSTTIMAGEEIIVYKSLDQAKDGRDALAKHMYERLFGWIVKKINTNLHPHKSRSQTKVAEIGILDIAGFENLQTNSFEQMCINMVNERLQYFMNNVVLIQEKKIYESEEIPFENVDFKDNMNIIQMFEISKIGIWPSLDEESKFQQGTDSKFVERLKKNFPKGHAYSPLLTFARGDRIGFGVKHFAGAVWYNCEKFLEKNRDTLNKDIEDVMKSSKDDCIADLFSVRKGDTGTISNTQYNIRASRKVPGLGVSIRAKTDQGGLQGVDLGRTLKEKYGKVGKPTELIYMPRDSKTTVSYFQKSISQLLSKMRHADSFFVRCIKPNLHMAPDQLEETLVRGQLKYNGISEICRIRKDGYPSRILIEDFIKRYKPLFSVKQCGNKDMVKTILDGTLPVGLRDKYHIGKHKVFMKESVNSHIERVHFIRQKWAASVIADGLKKNCEVQKRERLKKEQEEKERKRKLEEERKRKKEEESRNRKTEDQQGKDRERTAGSSFKNSGFGSSSNGIGSSYRRTAHDSDSDDTDKNESDEEPIDTQRFKDLRGTKKLKEREKISSSTESSSGSGSYDPPPPTLPPPPTPPPPRRGSVKKEQPGPPPKEKTNFWDIFQIIAREKKTQDVHTHTSLRILKVLTYIALFLMLLACLVIQKISLATLISELRPDREGDHDTTEPVSKRTKESSVRYMLTLIAVCTPYLLIFIVSVWRSLFGNIPFPSIFSIITCVVIEIFHSIGLCLLVFHLLPDLGAVQGIGLLSAVAIFPSLLKPLFTNDADNDKESHRVIRKIFCFVLDLLAFFVQLSAIPVLIVPYTQYIHGNDTHTVNEVGHLNSTSPGFEMSTPFESVKIVGALLLCSLSWWENFIDDKVSWSKMSRVKQVFFKLKFDLQESRPFISLFVAFFKVGTSVLFAYLLMKDPLSFDFKENFKVVGNYEGVKLYSDILALVLSGYVGYYLAYTVCKLKMQRLSFSIPCFLSTPIAMTALMFECNLDLKFVSTVSKHSLSTSCDDNIFMPWHHVPLAALWLLSLYWVARHIWFPKQERLAKVERLFVNPLYCGILLEQHLVLNRKRHNRRIVIDQQNNEFKLTATDQKSGSTEKTSEMAKEIPPMIYACATMWHENRLEIVQILKSLFRMDKDQFMRKQAYAMAGYKNMQEIEYYEFEAHILFDDAFELNDDEEMVPNSFVKLYASLMNEAASAVHSKYIELPPPFVIPSKYGGQVIFTMPGGNLIYTHLKDKVKIRHRKRWSQVMYMYYLLGYRIVKECQTVVLNALETQDPTKLAVWGDRLNKATGITGKSEIFQMLDEEVLFRAENTFLLALDGDVDFTPGAVRLLLDRMKKNQRVGASCGRIHPIGSGPMVWYQKFEYAVAHWLQKSTEHVLGCVLCSPGCFSLFRGSALMDDNVMRKYTILPTEASHHLMYDQGEDRWLCTLLLQQGYRVDYAAASDAFTYAPEGFNEYFNQRRRWTPSTIANILDLLQDGRNTVASNNNISWLYIVYQAALMVSTIIGPATVLMMIAGALLTVFSIDLTTSYIISLIPAIIFFIICFVFDTKIQLIVAQILSGVYVFIMMVVFVGAIITAVTLTPYHPSVIFLSGLVFIFLIAAAFHPREFHNLIFGILYFLWVPSGFLVLIIYSLCNLHVVSWGTREVPKKKTKAELAKEEEEKKAKEEQKKKESFWNKFFPFFTLVQDLKQTITEKVTSDKGKEHDKLTEVLIKMNENLEKITKKKDDGVELEDVVVEENKPKKKEKKSVRFSDKNEEKELEEFDEETYMEQKVEKKKRDDLVNPAWVEDETFSGGELMQMNIEERNFWEGFVNKYLYPLEKNKEKEKKDLENLMELRNNVCGGMALINILWVAINFMFQYKKPTVIDIPLSYGKEEEDLDKQQAENVLKVDVVGLMFIIFFLFILLIQFLGMIVHRWGTFMHLIAITEIPSPFGKTVADVEMSGDSFKKGKGKIALEFCEKMMTEPMPDYPSDDESIEENRKQQERDLVREQIKNNAETGTKDRAGQLNIGASLRNTMMGRESMRESYSNQLRRSAHQVSMDNADFLKKSVKYLEEAKLPKEDKTTGVRYRKKGQVLNPNIGKTLPENESSGVRRFGSTAPAQRDFMEKIQKNRSIAEKYKLNASQRNVGENLGQSFRGGESVNMEDDDIYDEIPATGTLGRMWAKKLRNFNQPSSTQRNGRNSGFNQLLS